MNKTSNLLAKLAPPYLYVILDASYPADKLGDLAKECAKPYEKSKDKNKKNKGARIFQFRAKQLDHEKIISLASELRDIIKQQDEANLFIINDSPKICQETKADGVHLGAEDESVAKARDLLGQDAIIGATIHSIEEMDNSRAAADYFGLGPVFASSTKSGIQPLGLDGFNELLQALRKTYPGKPCVAIGGIEYSNMNFITKPEGVALVSYIADAPDAGKACDLILEKMQGW